MDSLFSGFSIVFEMIKMVFRMVPWWLILLVFGIYVLAELFGPKKRYRRLYFPPGRMISSKVRREVFRRDDGKCVECGSKENLQYDHIIPFSKGGSKEAENIQLLCKDCNKKKSNKI